MSGIVGYINFSGKPIEKNTFARMVDTIAHRGPDGKCVKVFSEVPFVTLGHRHLASSASLIDEKQSRCNENEKIWSTFDGAIYNLMDIRENLKRRGHVFKSSRETEVINHAYEEWGDECINMLSGTFAFAVWDAEKQMLFAARDRLGVVPFYYYFAGKLLIFASELKAILASGVVPAEPDWESLHNPWHFQASPGTGFKNIFKLFPGHMLTFSEKGLSINKYWDISPHEKDLDEAEAVVSLQDLLKNAVISQTNGNPSVGAFLSGGLDSSGIVALMSQFADYPIKTYTIKFTEDDQKFESMPDDSLYARKVANFLGCDHQEMVVKSDVVELLPKMIWHLDEPLADPAAINTYLIAKVAKDEGINVLLNGAGGDEVFGGYRKQFACLLAEQYQKYFPSFFRKLVYATVNCLPVGNSKGGFRTIRWAKRFVSFASQSQTLRFLLSDQSIPPHLYDTLFLEANIYPYFELSNVKSHMQYLENNDLSYLTKMCLNDTKIVLPDHNLNYSDKATMAVGVEGRSPLIEYKIVEFMFGLHSRYRINGKIQKYLLKKAMEDYLPSEILHRPKAPFGSPLRSWVRGSLKEMIDDILNPSALKNRGLYNPNTVWNLIQDDRNGKEDYAHLVWTILCRELWFRTFIDL